MAQAPITPVIPNIGAHEEAIAASAEMIFTATDRKLIKERAGEVDRSRSFREVFKEGDLAPEVENEETTVREGKNVAELEDRQKIHGRMLKHSALYNPQEKVNLSQEKKAIEEAAATTPSNQPSPPPIHPKNKPIVADETAKVMKELKLNPDEMVNKFSLEEKELHKLVLKIKNLHLKRVLSNSQEEFEALSEKIKKSTLSASNPEARQWLAAKMDEITLRTAQYKIDLLKAMQSLEYSQERENDILWLRKITTRLAPSVSGV